MVQTYEYSECTLVEAVVMEILLQRRHFSPSNSSDAASSRVEMDMDGCKLKKRLVFTGPTAWSAQRST